MDYDTRQHIISMLAPVYGRQEAAALAQWMSEEPDESYCLEEVIQRLLLKEPIQYIFQHTDWRGLRLHLSADTLIPRPETAELVDAVLDAIPNNQQWTVLDVGTGSGCIAIAIAKERPNCRVWACDISHQALQIAQLNANQAEAHVEFFMFDALRIDAPERIKQQLQIATSDKLLIVSNPPYICEEEKSTIDDNVLRFEPARALFVPNDQPLLFYQAIAHWHIASQLAFEINERFANIMQQMLTSENYTHIQVIKDICGKDRIITASSQTI